MTDQKETLTFNPDEIPCQEISDPAVLSKTPLVSVHMITYNHEPYIAKAIEGVLMQETDFPIELIIGEDCSTDRTAEIVIEYQKKHPDIIRVITSDKNVGAHKNGWRAEKACRGKYVAYCEGDDFWIHPKKLQMQVDYLESHSECGLVHGDIDRLHQKTGHVEQGVKTARGIGFHDVADAFNGILLGTYVVFTCTACVRRSLLEEVRTAEEYLLTNSEIKQGDLPRWLYISNISDVHYFAEVLATYRVLAESASHSKSRDKGLIFAESSKRVRRHFAEKYGCADNVRGIVEEMYVSCVLNAAYHNSDGDAARHAFQALRESGHRLSVLQWAYYLGGSYKFLKIVSLPFLVMRRVWLRLKKRELWRKHGAKLADPTALDAGDHGSNHARNRLRCL